MGMGINFYYDFFIWWCCTVCVVVQEARQVDGIQDLHVQCCCRLQDLRPAPGVEIAVVGRPVQVANVVTGVPVARAVPAARTGLPAGDESQVQPFLDSSSVDQGYVELTESH